MSFPMPFSHILAVSFHLYALILAAGRFSEAKLGWARENQIKSHEMLKQSKFKTSTSFTSHLPTTSPENGLQTKQTNRVELNIQKEEYPKGFMGAFVGHYHE